MTPCSIPNYQECSKLPFTASFILKQHNPYSKPILVTVFEFDKRFSVYGTDFQYYDYNNPLELGDIRPKHYDLVIADPPFLSEECLKKTTLTMRYLTTEKIILCTGAKMEDIAVKINLQKTRFAPKHKKNLANEFCCFANFDINV